MMAGGAPPTMPVLGGGGSQRPGSIAAGTPSFGAPGGGGSAYPVPSMPGSGIGGKGGGCGGCGNQNGKFGGAPPPGSYADHSAVASMLEGPRPSPAMYAMSSEISGMPKMPDHFHRGSGVMASHTEALPGGHYAHQRGQHWTTVHAAGVQHHHTYEPVEGDDIDRLLADYLQIHPCTVKFVRLAPRHYRWGSKLIRLDFAQSGWGETKLVVTEDEGLTSHNLHKWVERNVKDQALTMLAAHPQNYGILQPNPFWKKPGMINPPHPVSQMITMAPVSGHWELVPTLRTNEDPRRPWAS